MGLIRITQDLNLTMHFQDGDKLINNIEATTTDKFSETMPGRKSLGMLLWVDHGTQNVERTELSIVRNTLMM